MKSFYLFAFVAIGICVSYTECKSKREDQSVRLCVQTDDLLNRCKSLSGITCSVASDCILKVQKDESDAVIVVAKDGQKANGLDLVPSVYAVNDEHYVIIVDKSIDKDRQFYKAPIGYDKDDIRSNDAARRFNGDYRGVDCRQLGPNEEEQLIRAIPLSKLKERSNSDKHELVCEKIGVDFKPVTTSKEELEKCFWDGTPSTAVYVQKTISSSKLDKIAEAFLALSPSADLDALFGTNNFKLSQTESKLLEGVASKYGRQYC